MPAVTISLKMTLFRRLKDKNTNISSTNCSKKIPSFTTKSKKFMARLTPLKTLKPSSKASALTIKLSAVKVPKTLINTLQSPIAQELSTSILRPRIAIRMPLNHWNWAHNLIRELQNLIIIILRERPRIKTRANNRSFIVFLM